MSCVNSWEGFIRRFSAIAANLRMKSKGSVQLGLAVVRTLLGLAMISCLP